MKAQIFITLLCSCLLNGCGDNSPTQTQTPTPTPTPTPYYSEEVIILGSSTLQFMDSALQLDGQNNNVTVTNLAKAGEEIDSMCIRIGALPASAQFENSMLNSDRRNYFNANWPLDPDLKTFDVKINTLSGEIGYDANVGKYYFFYSNQPNTHIDTLTNYTIEVQTHFSDNPVVVVNLGKNNIFSTDSTIGDIDYTNNKAKQCITWIDNNISHKILVVNHYSATNASTFLLNKTDLVNTFLKNSYPNQIFDLQGYIVGNTIWAETQITPSSLDLEQQSKKWLAESLSLDAWHVNNQVNQSVSYNIFETLKYKGWIK